MWRHMTGTPSSAKEADVGRPSPAWDGNATVTYLGHSTVAIEAEGTRLLTDPVLRDSLLGFLRRRTPLAALGATERPDAVLVSHPHYDHLDLPSLRGLPPRTPIVAPVGSGRFLGRRGFHEVVELREGERATVGHLEVTAVPARHGRGGRPGAGGIGSLGYLIEGRDRIYFAGDTELFDEMGSIADRLDLALLPVWGWGPRLGPGHLDPVTAAESLLLLRPRLAVPIHWGTFTPVGAPRLWPWLATDPGHGFAREAARVAPEVDVRVLEPGESLVASGPR